MLSTLQCIVDIDSAYLKVAAVSCNKLLLVFLSFLSIEHHAPQTLIQVGVVEGKIVPGKFSKEQIAKMTRSQ